MYRRQYLSAASVGVGSALGGCQAITGGGARRLGDPVEHRGLRVVPDAFLSTDRLTTVDPSSNQRLTREPPDGETFLLTRLSVEHVGDEQRVFPARGLGRSDGAISHYAGDDHLAVPEFEDAAASFVVAGHRHRPYHRALREKGLTGPVAAGSAAGWLVNTAARDVASEDLTIEVAWGRASYETDAGPTDATDVGAVNGFAWQYHDDARVEPGASGGTASDA